VSYCNAYGQCLDIEDPYYLGDVPTLYSDGTNQVVSGVSIASTAGEKDVTITWTANADNTGVTGYSICSLS